MADMQHAIFGDRQILFHEIGMLVEREAVRLQRVLRCIAHAPR